MYRDDVNLPEWVWPTTFTALESLPPGRRRDITASEAEDGICAIGPFVIVPPAATDMPPVIAFRLGFHDGSAGEAMSFVDGERYRYWGVQGRVTTSKGAFRVAWRGGPADGEDIIIRPLAATDAHLFFAPDAVSGDTAAELAVSIDDYLADK